MIKELKQAKWIKAPSMETVPDFRFSYDLKEEVKKISLSITAMGFYRVYINGCDITKNLFMPGYTSFTHRVQVNNYTITKLFKMGNNTIDILLGNGWGGARRFGWMHGNHPYFDPSLLFAFKFNYQDRSDVILSEPGIDVYSSYIIDSEIYDGEMQDKTKECVYTGMAVCSDVKTKLVDKVGEDIIEGERLTPKRMFKTPKGELLIDFNQNFTGYIEIKVKGKRGDKLSFIPCEELDKDGNFYNANYRSAKSLFSYTLTGNNDIFKPLFSFEGLRYIKLLDYPKEIELSSFTGILVHSRLKRTGDFECGNELINKLYKNIIYGQLSNYLDIPTDCPQRDERLGWLGDAEVFVRTAAINFNVHKFFKKWLGDLALDQHKDGGLEGVSPIVGGLPIQVSAGWGDAGVICPWEIYLAYGDKVLLKRNYPMMKKWVDYVRRQCTEKPYIWSTGPQFGDWLAQDGPYGESVGSTSLPLICTAFFYYSTTLLIKAGLELGYDMTKYLNLKEKIRRAYINEFFVESMPKGRKALLNYEGERTCHTQTALSLTLYFGLTDNKKLCAKLLKDLITENNMKMTTGFLGTPYILHALSDNGYSDIAYKLLLQTEKPSWLFSVLMGATTIWEHWDGKDENGNFWSEAMNSFNHYAYGAVYDWIFSNTLGIRLIKPNYKEVDIKVIPSKELGYAKGGILLDRGYLGTSWTIINNEVILKVTVPVDTICHVYLNNKVETVTSGNYEFKLGVYQ